LIAQERCEQLTANQVAAENKEKIDPNPAESIHPTGHFEPKKRGMVNDHYDDGECPEKIETRLASATGKARVNSGLSTASLRSKWRCRFRVGDATSSTGY